ncbi:MAG: BCCT family transporter [Corynebacterium sp.]|nr:BCCT family transporter [Corynebacterium sp.]
MTYPHSIHPALVPGVSVEDQRIRFSVDWRIVSVVGGLIVAFIAWGVIAPEQVFDASSAALAWVMENMGWVFTALATGLMFFLLILAFSRYGKIPLGLDGEKAEYSTMSWTAMLFAAGIGSGIIFFGPYEPMSHYLDPRPGAYDPATQEAVKGAMAQSAMHWGINAWAIYAIVATLFGTAASLGIGALQISKGVEVVSGWSPAGNTFALVIIMVLTIGTILSAVSGVAKGIRWLSNINMVLAIGLALFFFIVGPTAFLANMIPAVIVDYVGSMPDMLSANMGEGEDMQAFLSGWTTFYWAWWVSWSPFVGVFVAKISRGRTIRQFILGVLFIPSTIIVLAFTILGGTSIWIQRETGSIAAGDDPSAMPAPEEIFFTVLDHLPGAGIVAPVVIVMLAVFFITTADSASLVNSQLSQRGNPDPKKWVTVFWALCMAGIAVVILLAGGEDALQGLQNFITVTALPFAVVLVLMAVALVRELRTDPFTIRDDFQEQALSNAVVHGVREHGDNFAIAVEQTDADSDYATGGDFNSRAAEVTDWYTRTDEDGNPVDYDYETGEYVTGEQPSPDDRS